jgi:tetratricopeptide (TPR) repeat protein
MIPIPALSGAPSEVSTPRDEDAFLQRYAGYRGAILEAKRLVNQRQFIEARRMLQPCLVAVPEHWEAHYLLAQMAYEEKNVEESLAHVETAEGSLLKLDQRRRAAMEAAKAQEALQEAALQNSLSQLDTTGLDPHGCMGGELAVRQHALNDQRQTLGRAHDDTLPQPIPAELQLLHGNCLYRLKRFDEAKEHYQLAIEKDPAGPYAWNNLIGLYLESGEPGLAKTWLSRALNARVALRPELIKAVQEKVARQSR